MRALTAGTRADRNSAAVRTGSRTTVRAAVGERAIWRVSIGRPFVACWLMMAVFGCSSSTRSLQVFAAAGAKPAFDEAVRRFQPEGGDGIEVTYGGGGEVLARMVFVERGDVYIAPEQQFMKSAVEQGAVDPATIRDVAYMVPVLAVQKNNPKHVSALSDLARPGIRVAVTRPKTTCLGRYAPEIFRRTGLAEAIGKNVVAQAPRPDLLITWLTLGDVDAVITWHFYRDLTRDGIEVIWLSPEELPGIGRMQAAVSTYSENRDLAGSFVAFLTSADGRAVFERHGYIVDAGELAKHGPSARIGPGDRPGPADREPPVGRQTDTEEPGTLPVRWMIPTGLCPVDESCVGMARDAQGRLPRKQSND
jgi:molybdate transport system substrate-binding protein